MSGRTPSPVLPTLIVFTPEPEMLKLMVSLTPKVPGLWAEMSGSPRLLPALIAVIASRSETVPSCGVRSSAVVVTVMVAAAAACGRSRKRRPIRQAKESLRRQLCVFGPRPSPRAILILLFVIGCLLKKAQTSTSAGRQSGATSDGQEEMPVALPSVRGRRRRGRKLNFTAETRKEVGHHYISRRKVSTIFSDNSCAPE